MRHPSPKTMALKAVALAALIASGGTPLSAAERLTAAGTPLPARAFAEGGALEVRVDASGDEILSVHTLLRPASSNILLMRDRNGFWQEWSGQRADLIPAAARQEGEALIFKIFQTPPPDIPAMTITLAYQTPEGLKFGWFEAAEARE